MTEPAYVAQTAEPMTLQEVRAWITERTKEAHTRGQTAGLRMSWDNTHKPLIYLLEGWREKQKEYPKPHFQMVVEERGDD